MSLRVVTHVQDSVGTFRKTIEADTQEDWILLQELFHRASNLWPDAEPQVKKLADLVTNGEIMQDYGPDTSDVDLLSKRKAKGAKK